MAGQRRQDDEGGGWASWGWWLAFAVVSVGCGLFAVGMFSEAFPMANLSITLERPHALHRALHVSREQGWMPAGEEWRQAATFAGSDDVQNFFELEEGLQAWQRLLVGTYADASTADAANDSTTAPSQQQTLYYPYTWDVRHFQEGNVTELLVSFGPDGRLCGFVLTLPEDEAGPTIQHDDARQIAEATAQAAPWDVDLGLFERAESSHLKHPGGRTDHTFTYERTGMQLGREAEGRFQLTLVVGGDRLTQLTYSVKIPETFQRRFAEMRSYNNTIASVASIAMFLLFIVVGYGMGLFYLMRQGCVIWKPALAAGVFVGFLLLLSSMNEYPLKWMEYDTAESASTFMATNVLNSLATFVGASFWFFLSYMAAESLTRRAFPEHPQIWRFWEAAHTPGIIGRVVSGYMLVSVFFAYEVGLYFVCQRKLGWWVPSSVHEHPDILATLFPWVSSIALSLQAGSWEECCFRAVPLSLAAIVGRRFNQRGLFVAVMMIVQAVIFGAAHANYPSMPSFARLVELIIPSLMFGGVYLQYGLVPSIVLHFVFDVVWFALPLFASPSRLDQALVLVCAFAPLWLVLAKRWLFTGRSATARITAPPLNRDWQPIAAEQGNSKGKMARQQLRVKRVRVTSTFVAIVALLAVAGLAAWAYGHGFPTPTCDAPPLNVTRSQAIDDAKSEIIARYADSRADIRDVVERWYVTASVAEGDCHDEAGSFVWETAGGQQAYARVAAAGYLEPPQWRIRFVQFDHHEPDVAKRAERYAVAIVPPHQDVTIRRVAHTLPESSHGANLTRDAAEIIARKHACLVTAYDDKDLVVVSSSSERLPNRVDWHFTFTATVVATLLEQGEPRIEIDVSGAEVTDHRLFIHLPEEWRRERQNAEATIDIVRFVCTALVILGFGAAFIVALVRWSTAGAIDFGTFARVYGFLLLVFTLAWFNNYPTTVESRLDTSEPFYNQLLVRIGVGLLKSALMPFALALVLAHLHHFHATSGVPAMALNLRSSVAKSLLGALMGTAWGGLTYGARKLAVHLAFAGAADDVAPSCPSYLPLAAYVPALDVTLTSVRTFFTTSLVFLLVTTTADRFYLAREPGRRRLLALFVVMLFGGAALEGASMEEGATDLLRDWALPSLLFGLPFFGLYVLVLSKDRALVPSLVAALTLLDAAREAFFAAYPGAVLGFILSVPVVALLTLAWTSSLQLPFASAPSSANSSRAKRD